MYSHNFILLDKNPFNQIQFMVDFNNYNLHETL